MTLNKQMEQAKKKTYKYKKGGGFLDAEARGDQMDSEDENEILEPNDSDNEFINDDCLDFISDASNNEINSAKLNSANETESDANDNE